jgi:CheY-like chemotaxis protein
MAILLVEDEIYTDRDDYPLVRMLKREAFVVDIAETGNEALNLLSKTEYEAVILDIVLPAGEGIWIDKGTLRSRVGIEILKKLIQKNKKLSGTPPNVPIVVVSGVIDPEDVNEIISILGHDERYLTKPVKPEFIIRMLRKAISSRSLIE